MGMLFQNIFQNIFHSLNARISIVILLISFGAYGILRIVTNYLYLYGTHNKQVKANETWLQFVNHPDYNKALETMPTDLQNLVSYMVDLSNNTIVWYNIVSDARLQIILGVFLVLSPILVLLTIVINRYIAAPMQKLKTITRSLAQGDFAARTDLSQRHWDRYSMILAEDFNTMAGSLENLEHERRAMISDIAHELRTPITAMQLQLEAVQDGIEPLNTELIDALYGETELLSSLIVDLRTLSLAEARELSLDKQSFDLHQFIERVVTRFYASAQKKGIQLSIEGTEDTHLYADAERINQVLNNLMSNAIRYTPENGTVSLEVISNPEGVTINVINSGTPLPEEELAQLFNRFYRSGQGKVRAEGGSGLGLAIVKALTELHGGIVHAQNYGVDKIKFSVQLPQNYS